MSHGVRLKQTLLLSSIKKEFSANPIDADGGTSWVIDQTHQIPSKHALKLPSKETINIKVLTGVELKDTGNPKRTMFGLHRNV